MDGSRTLDHPDVSVRHTLKDATDDTHRALHRHALFSRLLAPDLTQAEYDAANLATLAAFEAIERQRADNEAWTRLTLSAQIAALREDTADARPPRARIALASAPAVLGGLYVAHGSAFGAAVIARALARSLPGASRSYFGLRDPHVWSVLCATLEQLRGWEVDAAVAGADAVFDYLLATPHGAVDRR